VGHAQGAEYVPKLFEKLRETYGFDHHLLHDGHHRYSPTEAAQLGKALEPYSLFWLEDVTPAENQEAFKLIRQHTTTPLAVGEIFNTIWDAKDLIQNQLIDYIRATIVGAGGITHLRRIADLASMYQIRTGCHGATDLSPVTMGTALHFDTWVPNFGIQEYMRHTPKPTRFPPRLHVRGGHALCRRHTRPRRRHRRGAGRQVSLQARIPPRRKAGRWHHVELVKPIIRCDQKETGPFSPRFPFSLSSAQTDPLRLAHHGADKEGNRRRQSIAHIGARQPGDTTSAGS
jgi:hypothetical protein